MDKKERGRPLKYLTVKLFTEFLNNDFCHLKRRIKRLEFVAWAILLAVIVKMIIDVFWG